MSPEQARGHAIDKRTDNWAFGCVLYEMLSGRRAFAGDTISDTIAAILEREPDWTALPPALSPDVHRLVRRCLQKDPHHRIHDIADARVEIEEALAAPRRSGREASRSWKLRSWAIGLAAVVVLGLFIQGWVRSDRQPTRVTSAPLRTVPLTSLPGRQRAPTFSPDGNQIAFVWDGETGNDDIYVQLVGAGTPLRLTTDPASDRNPAWSPDGRFVAFIRFSATRERDVRRPRPRWCRAQGRRSSLGGPLGPVRCRSQLVSGREVPGRHRHSCAAGVREPVPGIRRRRGTTPTHVSAAGECSRCGARNLAGWSHCRLRPGHERRGERHLSRSV